MMPYIPDKKVRKELNYISDLLIKKLKTYGITGNLNYFIFRTIKHLCYKYADFAHFEGDLQKALTESDRRFLAPYENEKIKINGDVE
jgi:hypothetical protein